MLINEILKSSSILLEAAMSPNEWLKVDQHSKEFKYALPFIEKLDSGEDFPVTALVDKNPTLGFIVVNDQSAKFVSRLLKTALDSGDASIIKSASPALAFQPAEEDSEGNLQPSGDETTVRLVDIVKDEYITGSVRVNLGNIAEIALGCAVTAKYKLLKEDGTADEVTPEMIIQVGQDLADGDGRVEGQAGKDNLVFELTVPSGDKTAFFAYVGRDPKGRSIQDIGVKDDTIKGITGHIISAAKYVNTSKRVAIAINKPAQDPRQNTIGVKSDGGNAEQQKSTKVDLKIQIDPGTDPSNPERVEYLNLLSIKAGRVKQFGQVSGYEFERLNEFFESAVGLTLSDSVKKRFAVANLDLDKKSEAKRVRTENYATGFKYAYTEMAKSIKHLKSDQHDLIERVYNGLLFHATRNQPGVEMVILSPDAKTAFQELTFGSELRNALDDYRLEVQQGNSDKNHILLIYGFPVTQKVKNAMGSDKELLVQYRSYAQGGAVRNVIEMGGLLKSLADWEEIEKRNQAKQQQHHQAVKSKQHPHIGPVTPTPPVSQQSTELPPVEPQTTAPQTTSLQGTEFTSQAPQQPGAPEEEQKAMMEFRAVLKNAGLLTK